jgi:DNA topoisomerase VI subunit B
MTNPNKTRAEKVDDILRDRARRLTQRVVKDQRHLEEIGREIKAIKMIARKHCNRLHESIVAALVMTRFASTMKTLEYAIGTNCRVH